MVDARSLRSRLVSSHWGRRAKVPVQRVLRRVGYELTPVRVMEVEYEQSLLERCSITAVIDVGANDGQTGRHFRSIGFAGDIHSFEPMSEAFEDLSRSAKADAKWHVRKLALSERSGAANLRVSANSVSSSLLPVSAIHVRAEPASAESRLESVEVSTLDDQFESHDDERFWLKIDVQGLELPVLRGAASLLTSCAVVQCELSTRKLYEGQSAHLELLAFLEESGFNIGGLMPGFTDPETGDMLQYDVLAIREP